MSKLEKVRYFLTYVGILILVTMIVTACKPNPQKVLKQRYTSVSQTLQQTGKFAEDTFYACLMNGLAQGLPLTQVSDDCATQLIGPDGRNPSEGFSFPGGGSPFDPAQITSACSIGDPTLGQSSGSGSTSDYGGYTYGGDKNHYYQYSQAESLQLKQEAIREAEIELQHFKELELAADEASRELAAAQQSGNAADIAAAEKKAKEANDAATAQAGKALDASKKAQADPNERPPSVSETAPDSICTQVLAAARETLRECNRNGWKSAQCQKLAAKMNGCPDPTQIYVDPDAGYSCGAAIDAEAVKDAWVKKCESTVKYGPGGDNPCEPPTVYGNGRYVQGNSGDICSDPRAMVDPESGVCIGTLEVKKPFGQPGIQELIVLALDKIGGPIVVLPLGPKPPRPGGPQPRPGPR